MKRRLTMTTSNQYEVSLPSKLREIILGGDAAPLSFISPIWWILPSEDQLEMKDNNLITSAL